MKEEKREEADSEFRFAPEVARKRERKKKRVQVKLILKQVV